MCKFQKVKYVNGLINVDIIPDTVLDPFIKNLKLQIYEYYKNKKN